MGPGWLDADRPLEERVQALVSDLDDGERTGIALGDFEALISRGLPVPHYVDSGTGLRDVDGATAFPAGIALGATFDAGLAEAYGAAVGAEARAAGFTVVLGPTLDLARDPRAGRIPEALGEDPYLSGLLGAAHVRGLQRNHLIAQVKHYVAYNGEDRRTGYGLGPDRGDSMDVRISTAVLQDLYLRPFRAAIEAGAWSMMGSYNRINGVYACESADLLSLPRREWGWQGFFCPDFGFAVRDPASALAAGLDLGALGGAGGRTAAMIASTPPEAVSALVGNLVRALIGSGLADDPIPGPARPSVPEHLLLAERTAAAATVLLRNEGAILPLADDLASIAVIGPSGADALFVTGGSAGVDIEPDRLVTALDGIRSRAVGRRVEVAQGSLGDVPLPAVPAEAFVLPDGSGPGVEVTFLGPDDGGSVRTMARIDHTVDLGDAGGWPARWRARLTSTATGPHRLSLTFGGRASVRLDGEEVMVGARELEQFIHGPRYPAQVVVDLVADVPALLEIDFEPGPAIAIPPMGFGPSLRLGWQPPDDLLDRAVAVAADCDVALVLVNMASGEGMDRDSLALPGDQGTLVRRVAAANPRTIVVLNTPGAVLLPWLDEVAAVLQVWYPGERFGAALAAVLFGDTEPGGRLPLTFPRSRADLPGGDRGPGTVPEELDYDADGGIGYRAPGVRPLFPFGHGLSYTRSTCEIVGHRIAGGRLWLDLVARNLGPRDTVHVAQLYAGIAGGVPELVGVARLPVLSGGSAVGAVELGPNAFERWDDAAGARTPVAGEHVLWVGTSSADLTAGLALRIEDGMLVEVR